MIFFVQLGGLKDEVRLMVRMLKPDPYLRKQRWQNCKNNQQKASKFSENQEDPQVYSLLFSFYLSSLSLSYHSILLFSLISHSLFSIYFSQNHNLLETNSNRILCMWGCTIYQMQEQQRSGPRKKQIQETRRRV